MCKKLHILHVSHRKCPDSSNRDISDGVKTNRDISDGKRAKCATFYTFANTHIYGDPRLINAAIFRG